MATKPRPIRAKTFKAWMEHNLHDYIEDIANHGADSGFPGLTYYSDTCRLYDKFSADIWERLANDAESMGMTPIDFIASFRRQRDITDETTFKNMLVWYAAEAIAGEKVNR